MPGASNDGLFQYTGQLWLEDAGVYYYKNRTYHAELGVFMQTDPIGQSGGINLYAYVSNDPVNATDPWGLKERIVIKGNRPDPCDRPGAVCDPDELDLLLDDLFDDDFGQIDPGLLELIEDLNNGENADDTAPCNEFGLPPGYRPGPRPNGMNPNSPDPYMIGPDGGLHTTPEWYDASVESFEAAQRFGVPAGWVLLGTTGVTTVGALAVESEKPSGLLLRVIRGVGVAGPAWAGIVAATTPLGMADGPTPPPARCNQE